MSGPVGALYLHVPFCLRKCAYCDFASEARGHGDALLEAYTRSLGAMVARLEGEGWLRGLSTAYVGGGTPTMVGPVALAGLIGSIPPVAELTFEANPESLTEEVLARAREAGASRVSVGVQSLDDDELRGLGRVHDGEGARRALTLAVASGLRVSADLMVAIPRQTPESLDRSVRGVLEMGVGHVSVYPLTIEEGTPFARLVAEGAMEVPSEDEGAQAMERARDLLGQAGLERYEVASHAAAGERCRHNMAYWDGTPYLGLGTQAASMVGAADLRRLRPLVPSLPEPAPETARVRLTCTTSARALAAAAGDLASLTFDVEELTTGEAVAEDLMLAARISDGIPAPLVGRACDLLGQDAVMGCLERLMAEGLLVHRGEGPWVPTERGWLMGNVIFGALWDLA